MKILLVAATIVTAAAQAQEPDCSTYRSEVTLGSLSGERIDSVLVQTAKPNLGRIGHAIARLHVKTQQGVIRRELLFAPGDTVDTLQIAESLRRLRSLAFLEYAEIQGRECVTATGHSLALTVVTRDSWTTRPVVRGSSSSRVGLTERNLLGSGRTASIDVVSRNGSIGVGLTTIDGFGFGTGVSARGQYQRYSDGFLRGLFLSRRQATVSDPWRASLEVFDQQYEPRTPRSDNFERSSADFIAGIRVTPRGSPHAVYLLGGFEAEHASLDAAPNADVVGPMKVERRFIGPRIGAAIVSANYDTLTWLLAGGSVVDVPRTVEGEVVVGIGNGRVSAWDTAGDVDVAHSNYMTHYDGWLGREWLPDRTSRVVSDLWVSGYSRSGEWHSRRMRGTITAEHAVSNGILRLSGAAEQLNDPDPDVRALAIYDRALAFVPKRVRFSESALTISLERTRHLRSVGGGYELDGSLYSAFSKRWDPSGAVTNSEDYSVGVAGIGLSLSPRRSGRGTLRLDYGVPIVGSVGVQRRPGFSITLSPWLESGRHRDTSGSF